MIVDKALYRGGRRQPCGDLSTELARLRETGQTGDFLWIGVKDPTEAEFAEVNDELSLHALAVEDAINGRQRVKIETYGDTIFVVLKALRYIEATSDIETGEVMVFVGDRFVVTVRRGEASPLAGVRAHLETQPELLARGPLAALHAIVDSIVDTYRRIEGEVQRDLEGLENEVFSGARIDTGAIYRLKRELLEFRRATVPLHAPLLALHRSDEAPVTDKELKLRFRDVQDHLTAVIEQLDSLDRLLSDMLGAHLAQVALRQNEDMRKISAWVAIAAVPTMIAGIYGMNFEFMPELSASVDVGGHEFQYGYFVVLAVMAAACLALYRFFRRNGWM